MVEWVVLAASTVVVLADVVVVVVVDVLALAELEEGHVCECAHGT